MANVNRPKGFCPIQTGDSSPWNQQATLYYIANDATNSYAIGDVVMRAAGADADGIPAVVKWTGVSAVTSLPLGVIVGIRVADPGVSLVGTSLTLERAFLPINSGGHYVYVVDNPSTIYEVQGDVTAWAAANMSQNCNVTITANQTTLSNSSPYSSMVATAPAATLTLPIAILGLVQRPDNAFGSYAVLRVRFNTPDASGSVNGRTGV